MESSLQRGWWFIVRYQSSKRNWLSGLNKWTWSAMKYPRMLTIVTPTLQLIGACQVALINHGSNPSVADFHNRKTCVRKPVVWLQHGRIIMDEGGPLCQNGWQHDVRAEQMRNHETTTRFPLFLVPSFKTDARVALFTLKQCDSLVYHGVCQGMKSHSHHKRVDHLGTLYPRDEQSIIIIIKHLLLQDMYGWPLQELLLYIQRDPNHMLVSWSRNGHAGDDIDQTGILNWLPLFNGN